MTAIEMCVVERLAILLADCPTFRTVTETADRAAALERIHIPDASDDSDDNGDPYHPLPRAIINPELGRMERRRIGIGRFILEGEQHVALEFKVPVTVTDGVARGLQRRAAWDWMSEQVGEIAYEMETLGGTLEGATGETHLNVESVQKIEGPEEYVQEEIDVVDPTALQREWFAILAVEIR